MEETNVVSDPVKVILWNSCQEFHTTCPRLIAKPGRATAEVKARVLAICALHDFTHLSSVRIGQIIERDHSTVLHHLKWRSKYGWLPQRLRGIERLLSAARWSGWRPDGGCEMYGESVL